MNISLWYTDWINQPYYELELFRVLPLNETEMDGEIRMRKVCYDIARIIAGLVAQGMSHEQICATICKQFAE